jgi:hypothetical protein
MTTKDDSMLCNDALMFVDISRRQLISVLDKPAFSRISQIFQFSTTIRGSKFHGIREKAGLSKTRMSRHFNLPAAVWEG